MGAWGNAIAQGIGAAAQSGADIIDSRMKVDAAVQAEQRAANIKLDTASRMLAIEEAMKSRAAQRFSAAVKGRMQGAPLEIAPGDPAPMDNEGMTVKPTMEEATQGALDDTLMNDPQAYQAGTGMLGSVMKERTEAARLAMKAKMEGQQLESRERIESAKIEQRDRADDKRSAAMMARIEASAARAERAGKTGSTAALVQEAEYMRNVLKLSDDEVKTHIFGRKDISPAELSIKILADARKNGDEITPAEAARQAQSIITSTRSPKPAATAKAAVPSLPAGAKKIGTSGGKPVYQTPDGKKFIQE